MKSALLTVAWNSDSWTFDALKPHYKTLARYLNLNDRGMVLAVAAVHRLWRNTAVIQTRRMSWGCTFEREDTG